MTSLSINQSQPALLAAHKSILGIFTLYQIEIKMLSNSYLIVIFNIWTEIANLIFFIGRDLCTTLALGQYGHERHTTTTGAVKRTPVAPRRYYTLFHENRPPRLSAVLGPGPAARLPIFQSDPIQANQVLIKKEYIPSCCRSLSIVSRDNITISTSNRVIIRIWN